MTRGIAISLGLVVGVFLGPIMVLANAPDPAADAPVLVVSRQAAALITEAGGRLIGPTTAPLAALATGDEGFIRAISSSDALWVTHGGWIAALCGVGEFNERI